MPQNHILKVSNDAVLIAQTKFMGVYIEDDLDEMLLLLSLVKGHSKSTLIRDMLRETLDRDKLTIEFGRKLVSLLQSKGETWEGTSPKLFKVWIKEEIQSRRWNLSSDIVEKAFAEYDNIIQGNEKKAKRTRKIKRTNEKKGN